MLLFSNMLPHRRFPDKLLKYDVALSYFFLFPQPPEPLQRHPLVAGPPVAGRGEAARLRGQGPHLVRGFHGFGCSGKAYYDLKVPSQRRRPRAAGLGGLRRAEPAHGRGGEAWIDIGGRLGW